MLARTAVLVVVASCLGCADDGISPPPPTPPYTVETVASGSYVPIELNESGHALLARDGGAFFWDGQQLLQVPVLVENWLATPDLGPDGAVLGSAQGRVLYWKDGVVIEIVVEGAPLGLASTGSAYFVADSRVYAWSGGTPEEIAGVPTGARIVGDDGTIYGTKSIPVPPNAYDSVWAFIDGDTIGVARSGVVRSFLAAPGNRHVAFVRGNGSSSTYVWHDGDIRNFYIYGEGGQWSAQLDVNSAGVVLIEGGLLVDGADSTFVGALDVLPDRWTVIGEGKLNDSGQLLLQVSNESEAAVVLLTPSG